MTKQGEIRMALVNWLARYDAAVERREIQSVSETIDEIISILHSQGIVIKVDSRDPEMGKIYHYVAVLPLKEN